MNMRKSLLLYAKYIDNDKIISPNDLEKINDLLTKAHHDQDLNDLLYKLKHSQSYEESVILINKYIPPKEMKQENEQQEELNIIGDIDDPDMIFDADEELEKGFQKVKVPNSKKAGFVDLILLAISTGFMGGVIAMLMFNILIGRL